MSRWRQSDQEQIGEKEHRLDMRFQMVQLNGQSKNRWSRLSSAEPHNRHEGSTDRPQDRSLSRVGHMFNTKSHVVPSRSLDTIGQQWLIFAEFQEVPHCSDKSTSVQDYTSDHSRTYTCISDIFICISPVPCVVSGTSLGTTFSLPARTRSLFGQL
ncbi:PREDICTED: uncharacterized protein LOC104752162 [Camelina sativa]|uniref:Uncharacterized protein LOC104752162 n=1 Tax=Camelina sativa TaxID=90675 RepID=A0ABM0WKV1_CAMSA|nr:PREDICTED: uncharacterized protein LOC104752162 [Camelina sativa]